MKIRFSEYCVAYCNDKIQNIMDLDKRQYIAIKNNWIAGVLLLSYLAGIKRYIFLQKSGNIVREREQ